MNFVISGLVADIAGSFMNIYILSRSKILLHGKHFVLRSIGSTFIGDGIMSLVICFMAFYSRLNFDKFLSIIVSGFFMHMIFSIVFSILCSHIIPLIKNIENIDTYDVGVNYNPFKF